MWRFEESYLAYENWKSKHKSTTLIPTYVCMHLLKWMHCTCAYLTCTYSGQRCQLKVHSHTHMYVYMCINIYGRYVRCHGWALYMAHSNESHVVIGALTHLQTYKTHTNCIQLHSNVLCGINNISLFEFLFVYFSIKTQNRHLIWLKSAIFAIRNWVVS